MSNLLYDHYKWDKQQNLCNKQMVLQNKFSEPVLLMAGKVLRANFNKNFKSQFFSVAETKPKHSISQDIELTICPSTSTGG